MKWIIENGKWWIWFRLLPIFVFGGWDQMLDAEFCWITSFGATVFVEDKVDEELVMIGWKSVKRFFGKNADDFELMESWLLVRSFVDDINVWIFGDVVPGGINVTNGELGVPVALVCWGLNIYVFDAEKPPLLVGVDVLSTNWNCKVVGGDDLPVVGVTNRIDDGVDEVGECRMDDPRVLFGLSGCVSARIIKSIVIQFERWTNLRRDNFLTMDTELALLDMEIVGSNGLGC